MTKIIEHYKLYDIFDQFVYLNFDDVSEIFGVKKTCFKDKIEVSFVCLKNQHDIAIETLERCLKIFHQEF